nr:PREDICTED: uncharacterized protein LOC109037330 [Bemisia tabaci]
MPDPDFDAYKDQDGRSHYRCSCPTHDDMCIVLQMYDVDPNGWLRAKYEGGGRTRMFLRESFHGTGVRVLSYETLLALMDDFYRHWWKQFWEIEHVYKEHELIPANDEYWKNEAEFFREEPK